MRVNDVSKTAEESARSFEAAVAELEEFVQTCAAEDWRRLVAIEGRTVAVMSYHCASLMPGLASWLEVQEEVPGTMAEQDEANAREARTHADVTPEEVLALVRANSQPAAAAIRAVSPEWLESTVKFGPAGGAEFGVRQLIGTGELHVRKHLGHIRDVIADPG